MLRAKAIPYKKHPERYKITTEELSKNRIVKSDSEFVYSFARETGRSEYLKTSKFKDGKSSRVFKNFKCNSCNNKFRIIALEDIQWAMCSKCGGVNVDHMKYVEEQIFENKIK